MLYEIYKKDIPNFLDYLISKNLEVIAPVNEGVVRFEKIRSGKDVTLDYINTAESPKEYFLPDGDNLFIFDKKRLEYESLKPIEKTRVIFGMRPCDANALNILDRVLLEKPIDNNYAERRKKTIIIAIECKKTGDNCFCYVFGTDTVKEGVDLVFKPYGKKYIVEVLSKKGEKLLDKTFFKKSKLKSYKVKRRFKKKIDLKEIKSKLPELYNSDKWKPIAERCIACAACTGVCPTCYCFEHKDYEHFNSVIRKRYWSSCLLASFSRVAGNHVIRRSMESRVKQFVYHKLFYFEKRYGVDLCVGCGRCISSCPVGIDFFEFINKLAVKKR